VAEQDGVVSSRAQFSVGLIHQLVARQYGPVFECERLVEARYLSRDQPDTVLVKLLSHGL